MKTTVNFLDNNHNRCIIDIEITTRNGYKELTICGDINNCGGQVCDKISPANVPQKQLIKLWKDYHLRNVSKIKNIEDKINIIITDIENAENIRKGNPLDNLNDKKLLKIIENVTSFSNRDAELCAAFVRMFNLCENDLEDIEINDTRCCVQGIDYIAGNDEEMDIEWDEELDNYIEECILPEMPDHLELYFDDEHWKRDAKTDGRGHALNRYDGNEEREEINETWYYAYRQ